MEKNEEASVLIIHMKTRALVPCMERCHSTLCCTAGLTGPLAHPLAAPAVALLPSLGRGSFSVLPRQNQKHRNENTLLSSCLRSPPSTAFCCCQLKLLNQRVPILKDQISWSGYKKGV